MDPPENMKSSDIPTMSILIDKLHSHDPKFVSSLFEADINFISSLESKGDTVGKGIIDGVLFL